ncbi:hypothetical protein TWF730_009309 [Orbilia blumenaviensis]|uniref:F-box domain-containing protein n=1 Tax=Orbilia blumenaviensis TaxID=1796055 RepID=A0AAV9UYN6_9PEZI
MPTTITALPTELHEQILHHLPWHDHFLAASVLPLWSSLLQTTPFRQKRHYDDLRNFWHFTPSSCISNLIFNRITPKRRDVKDVVSKLHLHALLDRCAMEVCLERGGKVKVVMNIPKPEQVYPHNVTVSQKKGGGGVGGVEQRVIVLGGGGEVEVEEVEEKGSIHSDFSSSDDHELLVTSYNITSSPLLLSDTVVYAIGPYKDYPIFDDRFARPPHSSEVYSNTTVHFRVPLEYPELLGNEKPQSLMGMVEDIVSYMNVCFEADRHAEWMRATFIGFGRIHHTDEVHFEIRYGAK